MSMSVTFPSPAQTGHFAIGLLVELFFYGGAVYHALPQFTATVAGVLGVIIAGMEYKGRKTKKKRRAPLFFLFIAIAAAMAATVVWIWFLLQARHYI